MSAHDYDRRPLRTLAAMVPGSTAEIRHIAFRGIREAFEDAGVREGDMVVCRGRSPEALVLDAEHGTLTVDAGHARFIEVDFHGRSGDSPSGRMSLLSDAPAGRRGLEIGRGDASTDPGRAPLLT